MSNVVSLVVPNFSLTLGTFDLTPFVTDIRLSYPLVEITTPQSRTGQIALTGGALLDDSGLDDQNLPSRWARGQQRLVLFVKGIEHFTGYILNYRYNKTLKTGVAEIGDQIALQAFERIATNIPVEVNYRELKADEVNQSLSPQTLDALQLPPQPIGFISGSTNAPPLPPVTKDFLFKPFLAQDVTSQGIALPAVFDGTPTGEVVRRLMLEAGKVNGVQIFSDVDTPQLTGEITVPVVTKSPIADAQRYAGVDRVWMYCDPQGRIKWAQYPDGGTPLFRLRRDQTADFEPDYVVKSEKLETIVVTGAKDVLANNPQYKPIAIRRRTFITRGGAITNADGSITQGAGSVQQFEDVIPAVGDPFAPITIPVGGRAEFNVGLETYLPTTQTKNVGYLFDQNQANILATFFGKLESQRGNSFLIKVPIIDAWIADPKPFAICHVHDGAFIMDAPELVISASESYLLFTGNKFGRIPAITDLSNPVATPTLIVSTATRRDGIERDFSEIGGIDTSLTTYEFLERDRSGVLPLVGGFKQWHRSEEKVEVAVLSNVSVWRDLSGNGSDFVARLGAEPQLEKLSRVNGKQVINFVEVTDLFICDKQEIGFGMSEYLVIRTQAWTGTRRILSIGNISLSINSTTATLTDGLTSLSRPLPNDLWVAVEVIISPNSFNGSNNALFRVGTSEIFGILLPSGSDTVLLGGAAAFRIAEFIRYGFALSEGDRTINREYLNDRYNFANSGAIADNPATPAPIVPPAPPNLSGTFTNPTITTNSLGVITNIVNGLSLIKISNVELISATKTLLLTSPYYQFLTPTALSVVVKMPAVISTDNFESEIMNNGNGANELILQENDGTPICTLSLSVQLRGVRVNWDSAVWRVLGVSYYG